MGAAPLGAGRLSKRRPGHSGLRSANEWQAHLPPSRQERVKAPGVHLGTEAMLTHGQQGQVVATRAAGRSKGRLSLHRGANGEPPITASGADPILRPVWGSLRPKWTCLSSCKSWYTEKARLWSLTGLIQRLFLLLRPCGLRAKHSPALSPFPHLTSGALHISLEELSP